MTTFDEYLRRLPKERRTRIAKRTEELWGEHMRLSDLRRSLGLSQDKVAAKTGVKQPRVSKVEQHVDSVAVGNLRSYLRALGGELEIVARFPGGRRVLIDKPQDLIEVEEAADRENSAKA
jgi:transcriptional regulator with XRE-family HTH domain